ncbi:hypothetical protein [Qipengyuania nanhaisediminis]
MTSLSLNFASPSNNKPRWTLSEIVGFARFFFRSGDERLDILLGVREL